MKFKCAACGGEKLEEVVSGVIQTTQVESIDEKGEITYGDVSNDGGEVTAYNCAKCGNKFASDLPELLELLGIDTNN